jgi:cohesin complex subunit SA-1/2
METSDNNASSSPAPRRSGRARVAPQKFSPEPTNASQNDYSSSKRKRGRDDDDDDDMENEVPNAFDQEDVPTDEDQEEEEDEDDDDDADADDEPTPRPKKSRSSQKSRAKKPAAKRTKVNGSTPTATPGPLAIPAVKLPNRAKKTTKVAIASIARRDSNDLYCEKRV